MKHNEKEQRIDNKTDSYIIKIITLLIVLHFIWLQYTIQVTYPANIFGFDNNQTLEDIVTLKGVFGDLLSGHAALLAFIWFIYGVTIQKKEFDILVKEHHAQSDIYEKQNQILTSQWIDQWISNLKSNLKHDVEEEKRHFYKLITLQGEEMYVNSFQKQIALIGENKSIIANVGSERLILKYIIGIEEIEDTVEAKITDEDLNNIFTSRLENDFSHIKKQFKGFLLMYIGSQIILSKISTDTEELDPKLAALATIIESNYFSSDKKDILQDSYIKLVNDIGKTKVDFSLYPFDSLMG